MKKLNLEELFEEIRIVAQQFEQDDIDADTILLEQNEYVVFSEEVLRSLKAFFKKDTFVEDDLDFSMSDDSDETVDDSDDDDFVFMDLYDDDDDLD